MKIGIFDSGVGGLTVLKALTQTLPEANFVYFGDTARFPYGTKSPETLIKHSIEIVLFLLEKNVDAIVIACNTATSAALPVLQKHFSIPIIGIIEPAIEQALSSPNARCIGIIGTNALVRSQVYQQRLSQIPQLVYWTKACPLLIAAIEENFDNTSIKQALLDHYLKPLKQKKIDTLILACTHFPLIKEEIQNAVGSNVRLIDPSYACAEKVKNLSLSPTDKKTPIEFYVSDDPKRFKQAGKAFLGIPIQKVQIIH